MTDIFKFGIPLAELPKYQVAEPIGNKPVEPREGIDYKLLDDMLEFIETHPRTWKQASWFSTVDTQDGSEKWITKIETVEELNSCGSSFCLAGHVALRTGFPAPPLKNSQDWERKVDGQMYPEGVDDFAQKILGVSEDQGGELFDGDNELIDLKRMVILLKINPEIAGWELGEVRNADDDEFIEVIREYLP